MFIILNGPLGIGKSTLAEALMESIDSCVMLNGDGLIAANPQQADELEHLHSTIAMLVAHHMKFGYRNFVIEHLWQTSAELDGLRETLARVAPGMPVHCFLLTLSAQENLNRIERRQAARAIDEREFELRTFSREREALAGAPDIGEPFDVSATPSELVASMLQRIERSN